MKKKNLIIHAVLLLITTVGGAMVLLFLIRPVTLPFTQFKDLMLQYRHEQNKELKALSPSLEERIANRIAISIYSNTTCKSNDDNQRQLSILISEIIYSEITIALLYQQSTITGIKMRNYAPPVKYKNNQIFNLCEYVSFWDEKLLYNVKFKEDVLENFRLYCKLNYKAITDIDNFKVLEQNLLLASSCCGKDILKNGVKNL